MAWWIGFKSLTFVLAPQRQLEWRMLILSTITLIAQPAFLTQGPKSVSEINILQQRHLLGGLQNTRQGLHLFQEPQSGVIHYLQLQAH